MNSWLERARGASIVEVAQRLGLTIGRDGKSFGPCPGCQRSTRASEQSQKEGRRETRGACTIFRGKSGREHWHCYTNGGDGCGGKGDVVALVALQVTGRMWQRGDREVTAAVREFFEGGGVEWPRGLKRPGENDPPAATAPEAERPRLNPTEASKFLNETCVPVTADPDVASYLRRRGLDPAEVAQLHLARALPAGAALPRWARSKAGPWSRTGHRLIVPMHGIADLPEVMLVPASVRARSIEDEPKVKALSPKGFSAVGLFFAIGPHWYCDGWAPRALLFAEGDIDTMTALLRWTAPTRGAVLGVISGSATADLRKLVPPGWIVSIATHADAGGKQMREAIRRELAGVDCELVDIDLKQLACSDQQTDSSDS